MCTTIGVAIPCYSGHLPKLTNLLNSIEGQTHKPTRVVISSSSTSNPDDLPTSYSFPVQLITTSAVKNAAENRNIAAAQLNDMDCITFIDADDIMHPQRIEILLRLFSQTQADIILHNFEMDNNNTTFKDHIDNVVWRENELMQCSSGCIRHKDFHKYRSDKIHHAQSSVKTSIFHQVQYPEEPAYFSREDCVFCHRVFSLPNLKNVYIANKLSFYQPSGTQLTN